MSEKVVKLCTLLREAKDKTIDLGGVYQSVESALNDVIEGLPKGSAASLNEEKQAVANLAESNRHDISVVKLMHMLHCEGK